jgi:uncharacterized membrane protein
VPSNHFLVSPAPRAAEPSDCRTEGRLLFVDAARAAAVLFMIQGHTLGVLLAPVHQRSLLAHGWLFLRGLTSCTFFLLAGFSFSVATTRHWNDYVTPSRRLARRLGRYLVLWLLGYGMHLPVRSALELTRTTPEQWQAFATVDVLQLVAVTLAALQAGVWLVRSRRRLAAWALAAAGLIVLATPVAWTLTRVVTLPVYASAYLTGATGSLFPLFPWAGYVFLGAALGLWYGESDSVRHGVESRWGPLAAGIALVGAGVWLHRLPWSPYGDVDFWTVSPNLFLVKCGAVLIGLAAAIRLTTGRTRLPGVVTALSRESLLVYVAHLVLLYRPVFGVSVAQGVGPRLGPGPAAIAATVLMGAMALLACAASRSRRRVAKVPGWVSAGVAAALFLGLI